MVFPSHGRDHDPGHPGILYLGYELCCYMNAFFLFVRGLLNAPYNFRGNGYSFDIPINVKGASSAETHREVRSLISWLKNALDDKSEKLYFVFNESDAIPYEPKWGQNHKYYHIKQLDATLLRQRIYGIASIRDRFISLSIPVITAPTALGLRQGLGSGTGGLLEDVSP